MTTKLTPAHSFSHLLSNDEIYANFDPVLRPEIINLLSKPKTFSEKKLIEYPDILTVYSSDLDEHELALS